MCCAGIGATPAFAACDERFPGSCRYEVSTTTVVDGAADSKKTAAAKTKKSKAADRKSRAESRKAAAESRRAGARKAKEAKHERASRRAALQRDAMPPLPQPRPVEFNEELDLEASTPRHVVRPPERAISEPEPAEASFEREEQVENTGSISRATPHLHVDETFNLLTVGESSDVSLESALLNRRDQMVGSAPGERRD
jgi:hypothetical protein